MNQSKDLKADFIRRVKDNKPTRWVRFGIVFILFLLWVIWMGSPWLLLLGILLFDIYITGYIPFTWWKKSKNPLVKSVMSWIDAIVYAVVLVYFIFAFIGQNYQIPSSSLEKTLLTGDYLFVDKTAYGPRVPMTPVYFPLVHNELPFGLGKSYLDSPSLGYKRLKGRRSVEAGDIVVFNFPAGDTVMSKVSNPDYYTLKKLKGEALLGMETEEFGKKIWRPVDRRENYVKRCVGLPGQRIKIVDGVIYIDGKPFEIVPENVQFNYFYQVNGTPLTDEEFEQMGIPVLDRGLADLSGVTPEQLQLLGYHINDDGTVPPIYVSPMTAAMVEAAQESPRIGKIERQQPVPETVYSLFPELISADWTRADYGGENGLLIPQKGMVMKINQAAWDIYGRAIRVYEDNPTADFRDGHLYIDGEPRDTYTFKMDYYFMMGDNRDNSLDSRYWGFVPEDHIVGTPVRVLISFDQDKGWFDGKIRWNRILKDANPDD
ncbi:MAG: signal peptidase I [Muribaculaceae bacterium]|nr:signal peptidase I [Muribaculaceae bacterium]